MHKAMKGSDKHSVFDLKNNKSVDTTLLPAIWKGNIDQLKEEAKTLNVTHDDVKTY